MNASYGAWNQALADRFFRPDCAGRPVYLSVDDDELEELAPHVGAASPGAAESLVAAVRQEFSSSSHYGCYQRFFRATREWRQTDVQREPPPYLALHALAVLAGSRMARDPSAGIASHNYYVRYNGLIGLSADAGPPPGFDELGRLWEDLHRWLQEDLEERLGRSTIRRHPRLPHIGYPISQCLLREADRRRLTEFFGAVGLEPGDEITAGELFTYLHNWTRPGCGLSAQATRVIREAPPEVAGEIAEIVRGEFDGWQGEVLDERGRHRSEIALVLEIKQGGHWLSARFWPRRPDGFPGELPARLPGGRQVTLQAVAEGWYGPLPGQVRHKDLERGLLLESDGYSLAYATSRVVPLQASEELGRWVSVRQLRAVEPHCVLTHVSALDDVRRFISRRAEPGWRELPATGDLPTGWKVFNHVQITSPASPSQDHLRPLAPRFGTTSSFEGGLEIASGQYLVGGEPDLWITVAEGDEASVEIDGEPAELGRGIVRFRLSEMDLPAGDHSVRVGGLTRRFATFDGLATTSPSGTGSLAHILRCGREYVPEAAGAHPFAAGPVAHGSVRVSGASAMARADDLPEPVEPPVLLPAGFERYTVLGRVPGEVVETTDPGQPEWLHVVGLGQQYQFFDQPLPFEGHWLVVQGLAGAQIRAIRHPPAPPAAETVGDGTSVERWCLAIKGAPIASSRHPEYEEILRLYTERASQAEVGT